MAEPREALVRSAWLTDKAPYYNCKTPICHPGSSSTIIRCYDWACNYWKPAAIYRYQCVKGHQKPININPLRMGDFCWSRPFGTLWAIDCTTEMAECCQQKQWWSFLNCPRLLRYEDKCLHELLLKENWGSWSVYRPKTQGFPTLGMGAIEFWFHIGLLHSA